MHHEAMLMIRTDLRKRIDSMASRPFKPAHMADEIDSIRRIARDHGLEPLERLSQRLQGILASTGSPAALHSYLDLMRDAAGCEAVGPDVSSTYLAALSLRLGA